MSWRTRLLAALVALLAAGMVAATVVLAVHYERNEKAEALKRATAAAVADIRARLRETEQSLGLLAAEMRKAGDDGRFDRVAAELLAANAALLRIELRAADGALVADADGPAPRPRLDRDERSRLGFEATLALRSALEFDRLVYSRTYYVRLSEITGFEVADLVVPTTPDDGRALVAVYSMPKLLDGLPSTLLQAHQVYLTEPDGTFVARSSAGLHGAGVYTASAPLDLPGMSLQLRTNSVLGSPKLIPNLLTGLLIVVTLALAFSGLLLWRDWRLRARAERALRTQHAFRKAMEDSLVTGLRARDLNGQITYVNPAFCRMTGYDASELIGCAPPMPYWAPEQLDLEGRRLELARDPATTRLGYETEFIRRGGERFPVLIFEAPLIDEHGRQSGWMGSILDLSEQKRVEDLNRRQQEKLQSNARMALLGEVASALSHELNQPLAAITSYATACENLLQAPAPPGAPVVQAALSRIRAQSERAGQVIRSVQDFMRRRRVDTEPIAVADLLRSVEPLIQLQAKKVGGKLYWRAEDSAVVLGDRTMLEQVLLNLTRNAFEAMEETPRGQRILEISATGPSAGCDAGPGAGASARPTAGHDPATVSVEVRDRGKGVPPALEPQLFSPFFTTKPDGLGIGLSLCRTVIEAHAGKLRYLQRDGGGAVFQFELPAAATPAAAMQAGTPVAEAHA